MLANYRLLPVILLALSLGACSLFMVEDDESVISVAEQLLEAQKDEYGEPRKIDLPIRVNYTINRKPVIDHQLEIEFEFIAERNLPVLRIGVTTDEGLTLASSEIREQYRDMPARQALKKSIVVIPRAEALYYLNMYVVTEQGEEQRARLIRVPIGVGKFASTVEKS